MKAVASHTPVRTTVSKGLAPVPKLVTATLAATPAATVAATAAATAASRADGYSITAVERALERLPPERREALLLVGASGFSYEEAAQVCDVAVGTMKSRIARGRAQLAQILENEREVGPSPS